MKKLLLGSFLAALAMFAFGGAYWMGPISKSFVHKAKNDSVLSKALGELLDQTGTYVLPQEIEDTKVWQEQIARGPLAVIHFQRTGGDSMPIEMLKGFLIGWVTTLLLALLLQRVVGALPTYFSRVQVIVLAGLSMSVFIDLGSTVWWYHSLAWAILTGVYDFFAWAIAGLVLAKYITPTHPYSSSRRNA